jgi:hypothetical protein
VLSLRSIESYLLDDEVLTLIAEGSGTPEATADLLRIKARALKIA